MAATLTGFGNANISAATADQISHHKVKHEKSFVTSINGTISATTTYVRCCNATGTLLKFSAAITETIATGADRTVTVDLHKSTGAGAFATVLSSTIGFTSSSVLLTKSNAGFSDTAILSGDILKVVVTVAGGAGNQALGLVTELILYEAPTNS
jgi:phosphoribosylpyrophosphate synthetase